MEDVLSKHIDVCSFDALMSGLAHRFG